MGTQAGGVEEGEWPQAFCCPQGGAALWTFSAQNAPDHVEVPGLRALVGLCLMPMAQAQGRVASVPYLPVRRSQG